LIGDEEEIYCCRYCGCPFQNIDLTLFEVGFSYGGEKYYGCRKCSFKTLGIESEDQLTDKLRLREYRCKLERMNEKKSSPEKSARFHYNSATTDKNIRQYTSDRRKNKRPNLKMSIL
jgi:hypothetical protein